MKISFLIDKISFSAAAEKDGRKNLEILASNGEITVSVWYDCEERPLTLKSKIKVGDSVDIVLLDYRIELCVNGEVKDEDWPAGIRYYDFNDKIIGDVDIKVCEYNPDAQEQSDVIYSFENASGWRPGNGVFVGDCMPYRKNDEYHVLYLKDRRHHGSKWGRGAHQWDHISTKDFITWQVHPMAVAITDISEASICTGSWIQNGDTEYLYYTVRQFSGEPAPICRSVSKDGYHFVKDTDFKFFVSEKYNGESARDPKVILGSDGLFHMFLTTALVETGKGCLAHFVSKDMQEWEEKEDPIYVAPDEDQPECPDYFYYNGKYYLIFSHHGTARYMVSDSPFENFVEPENPIIPCESVPKGAEWQGRLIFTGFSRIDGYAGTLTFKAARAHQNGELFFEDL